MNRLTAIFPWVMLLAACNTGNTETTKNANTDTALTEPAVDSHERGLQGAWFEVTRKDSDYIIYQPCGLDLRTIRVTGDSLYNQDQMEHSWARLTQQEKNDSQTIIHTTSVVVYTFTWKDKDRGLASWKVKFSPSAPEQEHLYVDSLSAYRLKKVNEPGCK
ncbi:hypothetical protein [Chitinophaga sp. Cy-1792]|uniref:hypothetical protein n=1 Tax=Chitinophaga sp. Cy-1792 TaxID=2608339 RepID=UPI00142184E4|nr:hypothetical protein [Chitinophaga sp. Cy-1792]NIG53411.1 hypothetical protein [Chitinophaga sp. Cy-1792]